MVARAYQPDLSHGPADTLAIQRWLATDDYRLTPHRRRAVRVFVELYEASDGEPVSYRVIARRIGAAHPQSARDHLKLFCDLGFIRSHALTWQEPEVEHEPSEEEQREIAQEIERVRAERLQAEPSPFRYSIRQAERSILRSVKARLRELRQQETSL